MPSRSVVKINETNSYYHTYTRGISKQRIFQDESDYMFFLSLFERYLSNDNLIEDSNLCYQKLSKVVEILAYCLMPNHFHLLLYQIDEDGMSRLMHGVMTSYSRYYNKKYDRSGPLFESRYEAAVISSDSYLLHISRYIHLNPDEWIDYPHSSVRAYLYDDAQSWLKKSRISELYSSAVKYKEFLDDYCATTGDLAT